MGAGLRAHDRVGVAVAVQIAKVVSSGYKGSKSHPCLDFTFRDDTSRPIPHDDELESEDDVG